MCLFHRAFSFSDHSHAINNSESFTARCFSVAWWLGNPNWRRYPQSVSLGLARAPNLAA